MIDSYKVGLKILTYRKAMMMTQDDLANQLFVTRQVLSKWENGSSLPSINMLINICKIFNTSFEDILCLDDDDVIIDDPNDLFKNHSRSFIISKIVKNEITINIPDIFYQLSPTERMIILKAIKENQIKCNRNDLRVRLTQAEQRYLFNHKGGKKR